MYIDISQYTHKYLVVFKNFSEPFSILVRSQSFDLVLTYLEKETEGYLYDEDFMIFKSNR